MVGMHSAEAGLSIVISIFTDQSIEEGVKPDQSSRLDWFILSLVGMTALAASFSFIESLLHFRQCAQASGLIHRHALEAVFKLDLSIISRALTRQCQLY
jgi:ABC-type multidrug transport system fused ATPase/permease subunit